MDYTKPPSHYPPLFLDSARFIAAREHGAGRKVYVVRSLLVTESRTYAVDSPFEGDKLARKLGVQVANEDGDLVWPRHPLIEAVLNLFR